MIFLSEERRCPARAFRRANHHASPSLDSCRPVPRRPRCHARLRRPDRSLAQTPDGGGVQGRLRGRPAPGMAAGPSSSTTPVSPTPARGWTPRPPCLSGAGSAVATSRPDRRVGHRHRPHLAFRRDNLRTSVFNDDMSTFSSLWANSPTDAWAVGYYPGAEQHARGWNRALERHGVERRDRRPPTNQLFDVWASGPSDVWVVGMQVVGGGLPGHRPALRRQRVVDRVHRRDSRLRGRLGAAARTTSGSRGWATPFTSTGRHGRRPVRPPVRSTPFGCGAPRPTTVGVGCRQ